ncbi:FtsX-like permease family protein [Acaryochloris marina]|uniref:ABC transporter, permease protein n=1 Tax=Acaryochloris marina (strain MBIC 11017) TaxID=329726 RepID=B0CA39_ACAM1|nr:FtsX-like permease family protein [Acaryochloris marina]ABW26626.1 ABC transporter, permease protein [Acaryochloris marina MBIC11017]BDM81415.1 ABC transporter permease [Acaryochloris marina MBIC10699]
MVSIARKNLFQDLPRFIVAQAGIMFSVGLVTIQIGILNGFTRSSTVLIENADADIWVTSEELRHLALTLPLEYKQLAEAKEVEGVDRAEPLIAQSTVWRDKSNQIAPIRIIGFDPEDTLFRPRTLLEGTLKDIQQPYKIFVDQADLKLLDVSAVGDRAEIGSYEGEIKGITAGTRSIVASPYIFTSLPNATAYLNSPIATPNETPPDPPDLTDQNRITYILVKAKSGENLSALKDRLEEALPGTKAFTQAELTELTQTYWQQSTGVGYILGLGAVVGIVVGTVVVGQILYSSVTDHLREFGTMKAMGSSDWYIYRVILEQALWMAVLGYLPGMGLCLGLGAWTIQAQAIQILISPATAAGVFVVTVAMCSGAAIFAIQKVTRLDPALVFKS